MIFYNPKHNEKWKIIKCDSSLNSGLLRIVASAWLLLVQFILLILAMLTFDNEAYRTLTWALGVLALLIIAKVIRQTPMFTFLGLAFVSGAIIASVFILLGYSNSNHPDFCP